MFKFFVIGALAHHELLAFRDDWASIRVFQELQPVGHVSGEQVHRLRSLAQQVLGNIRNH
eukprot:3424965-Pyramimonas_sp.AAC.1